MKVILTHAYYLKDDPKERKIMKPYPPLGILSISAWLDKQNIKNEVFDSTFSDRQTQWNYIENNVPDILAIYTNLITKPEVASLITFVKSNPKLKECRIVLGGPDVTFNVDAYLGLGAHILVIGEGEETMTEVIRFFKSPNESFPYSIDGIAFIDALGQVYKTKARKKINNIDDIPFPNRDKIDLYQYLSTWKKHHGHSTISISTQRGCPYTCKWCSTAVYGQSYRRRSPKTVVSELETLIAKYHPDKFWFVDDVFTISHKWLDEFKQELYARNISISFECITRADRMNIDVIKTLKEAGCFRVWIGAESGSQDILDAMDRRVDVLQVQNMIVAAKNEGIETGTFIMLGYPGETEKDIILTLDHLRKSNPDLFTITVAYPIKGTALYNSTESEQKKKDWNTSTDRDIDFKRNYPRPYYTFAVKWVVNSMRLYKLKLNQKLNLISYLLLQCKIIASRIGMNVIRLRIK